MYRFGKVVLDSICLWQGGINIGKTGGQRKMVGKIKEVGGSGFVGLVLVVAVVVDG